MNKALASVLLSVSTLSAVAGPIKEIDLADVDDQSGLIQRVYGSVGNGSFGVPVAGGFDVDGDGHRDYAFSAMTASPFSDTPEERNNAGQVFLVFGDGTIGGSIDTGIDNNRVLPIYGSKAHEHTGSEIWMADVTGDGLGDLIICRQDYSQGLATGEGAMTIVPGQADLKTLAQAPSQIIDLSIEDASTVNGNVPLKNVLTSLTHIIGANEGDRFCMWARNGDVTGDGVDDLAGAADQEDSNGQFNSGAVYLFRGGDHLAGAGLVDLSNFNDDSSPIFSGNIIRIRPPVDPSLDTPVPNDDAVNFHFGSTLNIATLDSGSAAELLIAAGLNRAGGVLSPQGNNSGAGSGGSAQGTVYILWENNFSGDWLNDDDSASLDFVVTDGPGASSVIDGGVNHDAFGEEIIGGLDYNGDGDPDVFFGDLTADGLNGLSTANRFNAGSGHIFYTASELRDQVFDYDTPPVGQVIASFLGPIAGAISGDTNMHGDFNNDGIGDIASSSPHDNRFGRTNSGTLHVLLGEADKDWPAAMDFSVANFPDEEDIKVINIHGAKGNTSGDTGDTLAYSGTAGDLDNDGYDDIIFNEMVGNGTTPDAIDVGNLLIVSGKEMSMFTPPEPPVSTTDLCFPIKLSTGGAVLVCL